MRLVHKPTVVDAVLWDDSDRARHELANLGYRGDCGDFHYEDADAVEGTRVLLVPTSDRSRSVAARAGESWVVRGVVGEWYCITNDVRVAAYDEVAS